MRNSATALSATAFFTASTMPRGGASFTSSGFPVSSTLLRLERIAGQPVRPPCRIASGMSHECASVIVSFTALPPGCSIS